MKTLNFEAINSSDEAQATGTGALDALNSMSTNAKIAVGVGTAAALTGAFFLGSWYAGRKADNTAAQAVAQPAAPAATVTPAAPAPAAPATAA